jgi:hypothetical protein
MSYQVTKQFGSSREQPCQRFKSLAEAKAFALECAQTDASMRIQTIYRIYDLDELLPNETIDSNTVTLASTSSDASGGSKGQQSGATFKPTPLEMSPRPPGTPPKTWVDDDKNKDK